VIAGEKVSDIDLFADTLEVLHKASGELAASRAISEGRSKTHTTANAITVLAPPRKPVQFITRWIYADHESLLNSFDFTVAQVVIKYDYSCVWYGYCSDRFYEDLAARRLYYASPIREEEVGGSLLRVRKFLMKGYTIQAWSLGMVVARLVSKIDPEKLGDRANMGQVIGGLLREVDPLRVVDGLDMVDEHDHID
jgi:hypothetical protein